MRQMVSDSLRSAAETAIASGLDFLESAVESDGAWRCDWHGSTEPEEDRIPPFVAALGVLALEPCTAHRTGNILSRSCGFILSPHGFPGIWR